MEGAWRCGRWWACVVAVVVVVMVPGAAAATDPRVDSLATVLREVTGQLEQFNNLYINKLERELSASTAKIAALEAAVRSIGDRAAAWDNIQNHMTVWTDQSRTMERKLDLLNRCHEKQDTWEVRLNAVDALNHKLTALDKKINAMTRLEFKVEQVSERVEEVNSKVNWVKKQMAAPEQPIITEFAGRGLLSSLVQIEAKLDNMSRTHSYSAPPPVTVASGGGGGAAAIHTYNKRSRVLGTRYRQLRPTVEPEPGITFTQDDGTTCQLGPRDSRRLQDVSGKVDLLFDRITDPDYDYDYFVSHLHRPSALNAGPGSGGGGGGLGPEPGPEQLFARFWKSIFSPFKKMNRKIRGFETQLTAVHKSCNGSASMEGYVSEVGGVLQKKLMPLDQALREEMLETRMAVNEQSANIQKVSQAVGNTAYLGEQLMAETKNQFHAHRVIMQERFDEIRNLVLHHCSNSGSGGTPTSNPAPPQTPPLPPPLPPLPPTPTSPPAQPSAPRTPTSRSARDCTDLLTEGYTRRTITTFSANQHRRLINGGHDYFRRYCDQETAGGGWTVVQRRGMFGAPYDNFTRTWDDYRDGFGDLTREFWWGNDNIYRMVRDRDTVIRFDLWDFEGNYAYAEYLSFKIAPESDDYRVTVFGYRGNASDSFSAHNGYRFSTIDRDNDEAPQCCPCAPAYGGGWWFYSCFESNLNGDYHTDPKDNDYYRGIIWELWLGDYSLRATEIKLRPASFSEGVASPDPVDPPSPRPDPYPTDDPLGPELPLIQL